VRISSAAKETVSQPDMRHQREGAFPEFAEGCAVTPSFLSFRAGFSPRGICFFEFFSGPLRFVIPAGAKRSGGTRFVKVVISRNERSEESRGLLSIHYPLPTAFKFSTSR
jgi:hypothetical protein